MAPGMGLVVAIVAVVLVAALIIWFVATRQHPERAATHTDLPAGESTSLFGRTDDRPGGPGLEADGVAGAGQPAPGPSASSLTDNPPRTLDPERPRDRNLEFDDDRRLG